MLDTGHRRIFCPSAEQLFRRHWRGCGSRSAAAGLGTSEHQIAAIIGISGNTSLASINTRHSPVQLRGWDGSLGLEYLCILYLKFSEPSNIYFDCINVRSIPLIVRLFCLHGSSGSKSRAMPHDLRSVAARSSSARGFCWTRLRL